MDVSQGRMKPDPAAVSIESEHPKRWRTLGLLSVATVFGLTVWFSTNAIAPALVRIHRWTRMEGVRTAEEGEGVAGAMIRAGIRVDGRLAGGRRRFWGRRWRSAVAVLSEMAG